MNGQIYVFKHKKGSDIEMFLSVRTLYVFSDNPSILQFSAIYFLNNFLHIKSVCLECLPF